MRACLRGHSRIKCVVCEDMRFGVASFLVRHTITSVPGHHRDLGGRGDHLQAVCHFFQENLCVCVCPLQVPVSPASLLGQQWLHVSGPDAAGGP